VKILFLIRSLNYGGQERQLVLLSKRLCERGHDVVLAIFYAGGPLQQELVDSKVRIRALKKRGRWDVLRFLWKVSQVLCEERPDVIHGYLLEPNIISVLCKPLFPKMKVVWGVRSSNLDFKDYDWLMRLSCKLNVWLSRFPDRIIANSHAGHRHSVSTGYPAEKIVVIPNGIDTERFRPDPNSRSRMRSEWGVAEHEKLIGLVGRLDPMKDHPTFLEAAAMLAHKWPQVRFVCVGHGPDDYLARLQTLAVRLGLEGRVLWAGARQDMPAVHNALDIAVNSSCYGEGLSNAVAEAMACGVPCVVTNIGDSALVVGHVGEVVPPKDPVALKNAIEKVLVQRPHPPAQVRLHIVERLSVEKLVIDTERVLFTLS
jgi:glycosyltransferase involved in cell wall biosynthesis